MTRTEIINYLINTQQYHSYLEIGVSKPEHNFDQIKCRFKLGVDPNSRASFTGTSDEFFQENTLKWDLVFIDGLHEELQVTQDINHALAALNPGGLIVIHDCLPLTEAQQSEHYNGDIWCGTVWRSLAKLRMTRNDLTLTVINTDWGVGIIELKPSSLYPKFNDNDLTYNFLQIHAAAMFNLIEPREFIDRFTESISATKP